MYTLDVTRYIKGGRRAISLRFDPVVLKNFDALAKQRGASRNGLFEQAARQMLEKYGIDPDREPPAPRGRRRPPTGRGPKRRTS